MALVNFQEGPSTGGDGSGGPERWHEEVQNAEDAGRMSRELRQKYLDGSKKSDAQRRHAAWKHAETGFQAKMETMVATLSQATWGAKAKERLPKNAEGLLHLIKTTIRAYKLVDKAWRDAVSAAADDLDPDMTKAAAKYKELRESIERDSTRLKEFKAACPDMSALELAERGPQVSATLADPAKDLCCNCRQM